MDPLQSLRLIAQQILSYKTQSLFSQDILKLKVDTILADWENTSKL